MTYQGALSSLIAFAAVALLLLLARRPGTRRSPSLGLDPADVRELDVLGERLVGEHRARTRQLVAARLQLVLGRGVPVQAVEPTGVRGQGVLRFADSTSLLVAAHHPADLAVLSMHLLKHRVRLVGYVEREESTELDVSWGQGHLHLRAVGVR